MLFNRSANSSDCSQFIPKRIKLCITKFWEAGNRKLKRVLKIIFKNEKKKLFILYSTRNDGTFQNRSTKIQLPSYLIQLIDSSITTKLLLFHFWTFLCVLITNFIFLCSSYMYKWQNNAKINNFISLYFLHLARTLYFRKKFKNVNFRQGASSISSVSLNHTYHFG